MKLVGSPRPCVCFYNAAARALAMMPSRARLRGCFPSLLFMPLRGYYSAVTLNVTHNYVGMVIHHASCYAIVKVMGNSESTVSHRRRLPVAARRPSVVLCMCVCARATARLSRGPKPVCLAHPFTCVRLGVVPGLSAPSRRRSRQFPSISIFCPFSPFRPPSLLPVPHPLIRRRQTRFRAPFVVAYRPAPYGRSGGTTPHFSPCCRSFALCCRFGTTGERAPNLGCPEQVASTRLCRPGRLDLVAGGAIWAGRSSFPRCSSAMALELVLPSPPFDRGLGLGQGRPRWGLLKCL